MGREAVRAVMREYLERGDPTGWFEAVYRGADGDADAVPWADRVVNPHLAEWLARERPAPGRALDVGCGLGDNAAALVAAGQTVTAFDVSAAAVDWARRRFPDLAVDWRVADALQPLPEWHGAFDLVVEVYTLQVLPPPHRGRLMAALAACVAPGGTLLAVCRGREPAEPEGAMPWPLTPDELRDGFAAAGLVLARFEDFADAEEPPVRRLRAAFTRPA